MSKYMDDKSLFSTPSVSQYGSHMVMSNVMKEMKTKFINIDTKFSDDYVNNLTNIYNPSYNLSNYTFTLPQRVNEIKSMTVSSIEIPNVLYNICSSQGNNYFKVTSGGISKMIVLVDGYYSNSSLTDQINFQLSSQFPSSKIYYGSNIATTTTYPNVNGNLNSFFYSRNVAGVGGTIDFAVSLDGSFDKYNFKMKLGWILGFRNMTYTINNYLSDPSMNSIFGSLGSSLTYTQIDASSNIINIAIQQPDYFILSENFVNINTNKYFYLVLDEFCNGYQNSFISPLPSSLINKNIIAKIMINNNYNPFGSIITGNQYNGFLISDKRTYNGKVDIQKLNIQLVNENGQVINLNGFDFSFSLKVQYE